MIIMCISQLVVIAVLYLARNRVMSVGMRHQFASTEKGKKYILSRNLCIFAVTTVTCLTVVTVVCLFVSSVPVPTHTPFLAAFAVVSVMTMGIIMVMYAVIGIHLEREIRRMKRIDALSP